MKHWPYLLLLLTLSLQSTAQELNYDEEEVDEVIDLLLMDDPDLINELLEEETFHFLYGSLTYDNRAYYAAREFGNGQDNMAAQFTYFNSKGFYAGIASSWYSQMDPQIGSTILSLGYSKKFKNSETWSWRTSYNHYIYNVDDENFRPSFFGSLRGGSTYRNDWFATRFDLSMLVGREVAFNANWSANGIITLFEKAVNHKLEFLPRVSLLGANDVVEVDYLNAENQVEIGYEDRFGLMAMHLTFPLSFTFKNLDIEGGYIYNVPFSVDPQYSYASTGSVYFSLGYILDL